MVTSTVNLFSRLCCTESSLTHRSHNVPIFLALQPKQEARLGSQGSQSVMSHPFFEAFDWGQLERGKLAVRCWRSGIFLHRKRKKTAVIDNTNSDGGKKSKHSKVENENLRYYMHPMVVAPLSEIPPDPHCRPNLCLAFVLPQPANPPYAIIPCTLLNIFMAMRWHCHGPLYQHHGTALELL